MVVHAQYPLGETRVQREAMALLDAGHEVDVVCLRERGEAPREVVDGVTVHRLPVRRHRGVGAAGQLLEYLAFALLAAVRLVPLHRRRRYGVVQVHNLPDFLVFAALWPKLRGARVILDIHDLMPELFAGRAEVTVDDPRVRPLRWQEQLSCRFADHVVTVTEHWRETLIERGVPARKVGVVMNLADSRLFDPQRPDLPARPADDERFEVLYHGTFTHRYGVDLIVRAAHELRDDLPGLHVSLVGAGETRDELVALVGELGLDGRVSVSDTMRPAEALPAIIAAADVGVVPNRSNTFTDGILPTKLLEYVAMGLPVVASRTPGVAAYFGDDAVEFFPPGDHRALADALRRLHADPARRAELRRGGAAFNEGYDWPRHGAQYVQLVEGLARTTEGAARVR